MIEEYSLEELVREFFRTMDIVEESDEGRIFHPNVLRSCRTMDAKHLNAVLAELKKRVGK